MKRLAAILGVMALVAVLGAFGVSAAFAQTATPQTTTPPAQATPGTSGTQPGIKGLGLGHDFGLFGGSTAAFDAEAKALNLTPTQLFEQLHSGKTLSEIAQAQGVDIATVQAAAQAVQTQSMKDQIAAAVQNGTMTQDQANWLLQGIDKGYIGGGRGGLDIFGGRVGRGHGGPGLLGGNGNNNQTAPQAPSGTTGGTQG